MTVKTVMVISTLASKNWKSFGNFLKIIPTPARSVIRHKSLCFDCYSKQSKFLVIL
jgi:hypothetical protein